MYVSRYIFCKLCVFVNTKVHAIWCYKERLFGTPSYRILYHRQHISEPSLSVRGHHQVPQGLLTEVMRHELDIPSLNGLTQHRHARVSHLVPELGDMR